MRRVRAKYGYCVLVSINLRVHVPEELILTAELCTRQVLEVEVITLWRYCEHESSVVILLEVRLSVFKLAAAEN